MPTRSCTPSLAEASLTRSDWRANRSAQASNSVDLSSFRAGAGVTATRHGSADDPAVRVTAATGTSGPVATATVTAAALSRRER
jgi:hypothetical protein